MFSLKNFSSKNVEFENDHAENHVLKIGVFFKKNGSGYADTIGCY